MSRQCNVDSASVEAERARQAAQPSPARLAGNAIYYNLITAQDKAQVFAAIPALAQTECRQIRLRYSCLRTHDQPRTSAHQPKPAKRHYPAHAVTGAALRTIRESLYTCWGGG